LYTFELQLIVSRVPPLFMQCMGGDVKLPIHDIHVKFVILTTNYTPTKLDP
jgi:hypothetical protein